MWEHWDNGRPLALAAGKYTVHTCCVRGLGNATATAMANANGEHARADCGGALQMAMDAVLDLVACGGVDECTWPVWRDLGLQ